MERSNNYRCAPRVRLVTVEQAKPVAAESEVVRTPAYAAEYVRTLIGKKDREHFVALHLDAKHRVVSSEVVSVGTLSSSIVHPREVYKAAFLANAAGIICAHNHPSGDLEPSMEDRALCDRLLEAGKLLGLPLVDFLIVSEVDSWSGRQHWSL